MATTDWIDFRVCGCLIAVTPRDKDVDLWSPLGGGLQGFWARKHCSFCHGLGIDKTCLEIEWVDESGCKYKIDSEDKLLLYETTNGGRWVESREKYWVLIERIKVLAAKGYK